MPRCPSCQAEIATRTEGVRCTKCAAAHHRACWEQNGKCSIMGCEATAHRPMTKLATARVAVNVGRQLLSDALETARERLGGKSTVGLFFISCCATGLGVGPLLYGTHASRKVDLEVVLGAVFAILAAWITGLLYRGAQLEDDLTLRPLEKGPSAYMPLFGGVGNSGGGSGGGGSGCSGTDLNGCGNTGGSDAEGIIVLIFAVIALALIVFVVLPLVAFLAVEIVFPVVVIATYGTLYGALAFAVNGHESLKGRFFAALGRGVFFAAFYTGLLAAVLVAGVKVFHMFKPVAPPA
jgi:hypothetical protein